MIERITWLVEGRVVHCQFTGTFTIDDIREASRQIEVMVDQFGVEPGVHVIQDAYHSSEVDKSVFNFGEVRRATYKHPLIRWTIVVDPNPNPVMKFIGTALSQVFRTSFRVVKTLDEGKSMLRRMDTTLMNMPALYPSGRLSGK